MYNKHDESLREDVDCKKILQENIVNTTAERDYFEKLQCYKYLEKDLQHISNKYLTQKLNVVNKFLDSKEAN